jgi:hypothetical protein
MSFLGLAGSGSPNGQAQALEIIKPDLSAQSKWVPDDAFETVHSPPLSDTTRRHPVPSGHTMIVLEPPVRKRLRLALIKHRQGYTQSEGVYAKTVLKVALNTYKKCIAVPNGEPLGLKRHTLVGVLKAAHIDPASVGIDVVLPSSVEQYGNYDPGEYAFLAGTYFLHRRSFQTGMNIVRGVFEIKIDLEKRCLAFEETHRYIADGGIADESRYTGEIYMNPDRSLYSMLAITGGQTRLMMTQSPVRSVAGSAGSLARASIRLRGAVLTHGLGKGVWQPTVSAVSIESLPERQWKQAKTYCRTIKPDDPEFEALDTEICHAEHYASVMTPLMYSRPGPRQPGRPAGAAP